MISEGKREVLRLFREGRKRYKLMEFEEARDFFAQALKVDPSDGPSRLYYARCKHYIEHPPPEDWDGVFVMQNK